MKTDWKKIGMIAGAVLSILGIIAILYKIDCWNVKAAGTEHFTTLPTFLAMQKQVEGKFVAWDIKDKQRQISEYDAVYGAGCVRCDVKLKTYYDWLVLERNKLIDSAKAPPAK
jgi:hypothetical protein